jgi:hypothetical protein
MRKEVNVSHIWEMRNAYKFLVGEPKEKEPLGRPKHRWKN